ncbi:MAG: metallophosphoesterase family protein [Anaerolineales bacterium]|nr:metallophosphoesterase family protein [Anaerolineales bacterium]
MKVLVISDIHANLSALNAVLDHAPAVDAVWCLGDIVGYGPDPNECVETIRELPNLVSLRGNHDGAVCGLVEKSKFNYSAQEVLLWTEDQLKPNNRSYLASLPAKTTESGVTLAHGSPRRPVWEYIMDSHAAEVNFTHFETDYCLVGHSHFPVLYLQREGKKQVEASYLGPNEKRNLLRKTIVNPGSVGQPRDHDHRAAYALLDTDENLWSQYRISYDVHAVQQRMRDAGLPENYIQRIESGW